MSALQQTVVILDFGSQYTQLIARRIRELHVYSEILPYDTPRGEVMARQPAAVILSGGPASVDAKGAPDVAYLRELEMPLLGICYGQQLLAKHFGGRVEAAETREYGRTRLQRLANVTGPGAKLLATLAVGESFDVWMSHGDSIAVLPPDFVAAAASESTPYAAIVHRERPICGLQFHPEVSHTPRGMEILQAFLFDVAHVRPTWTMASFLDAQVAHLRALVPPDERVLCALSGGVDSAVVAALLARAIGERLACVFVDNGLLRQGEAARVRETFAALLPAPLRVVEAGELFVSALAGVTDPERKRKIIGARFIEVFEAAARGIDKARFLAQGTLYPDVIESVSARGPSATIKSHHNVGGLPARMHLQLIEPLRELFKDEVRLLGAELGLPARVCSRQPFPGPGLAVRILGEVTADGLEILRQADAIVEEEMLAAGYYDRCWQSFAVLLPVRSVGVMGDARTYEQTIAVRCVDSVDGMTADWSRIPYDVLARLSSRIANDVRGVNRVVYDISSKPPATIEWE
jgi:GMP synthase (glutamine-hydrolysing)